MVYTNSTEVLTSGLNWGCVQGIDYFAWKTPVHCLQAAVHDIQETVENKHEECIASKRIS